MRCHLCSPALSGTSGVREGMEEIETIVQLMRQLWFTRINPMDAKKPARGTSCWMRCLLALLCLARRLMGFDARSLARISPIASEAIRVG